MIDPQTIGLAVLLGVIAGIVVYLLTAQLDKRSRDRNRFQQQLEYAATKIGLVGEYADILDEVRYQGNQMPLPLVTPTDWMHLSLRYSDYLVIPRSILVAQPPLWIARMNNLLNSILTPGYSKVKYIVTRQDPETRLFLKNPK